MMRSCRSLLALGRQSAEAVLAARSADTICVQQAAVSA